MSDEEKIVEYELQIEDMLRTLQKRIDEFGENSNLSEFEQGRHLAYFEMWEIIKTRHHMIIDVISDEN